MTLYKNKYRIESTRLKDYDYSTDGAYFVTLCTKNRLRFFGEISDGKMILSDIGNVIYKYWFEIPNYFDNVILDEFVVMPDHIHGIIFIDNNKTASETQFKVHPTKTGGITGKYNPQLSNHSLSKIIRWYKGRCTFEINKMQKDLGKTQAKTSEVISVSSETLGQQPFCWLSRFYESIIRDERAFNNIRKYIIENPEKMQEKEAKETQ